MHWRHEKIYVIMAVCTLCTCKQSKNSFSFAFKERAFQFKKLILLIEFIAEFQFHHNFICKFKAILNCLRHRVTVQHGRNHSHHWFLQEFQFFGSNAYVRELLELVGKTLLPVPELVTTGLVYLFPTTSVGRLRDGRCTFTLLPLFERAFKIIP